MTKYLEYNYVMDRIKKNSVYSKVYQDAQEALDILNYQYAVYGNHSTKQAIEAYAEYAESIAY